MTEPMSEERLAEFRRIERDAYQRDVDHQGWFPVVYATQCLDEIDRLRAELKRWKAATERLRYFAGGENKQLDGAIELIARAREKADRLKAENERLREANHNVRVCRDHTSEIVGYGCLVCEIERLRRVQDEEIMAGRESLAQEIRHLLRARQYWGGTTEISSVINAVGAALDHVDALENRVAELAPNQEAKSE